MARRSHLDLTDYLPYLINRVGSALVARFSEEALAGTHLNIATWRVLAALSNRAPLRQIDIAEITSIEGSTMSVVLALPAGTATLQANIISSRPAEEGGHVVGAVIERIDSVSEQRLQEFLENPPVL